MADHSLLCPSGAESWLYCVGSPLMQKGLVDQRSKDADDGTTAHSFGATALRMGRLLENGDAPDEMIAAVNTYVSTVWSMAQGTDGIHVEERLDLSRVISQVGEGGTPDAWFYLPDTQELQVHDLKYGVGITVDAAGHVAPEIDPLAEDTPDGNEQLKLYGCGALEALDPLLPVKSVRLVIHQPRLSRVDEWTATPEQLAEWLEWVRMKAAYAMHLYNNPGDLKPEHLVPAMRHCRWCLAKPHCEALEALVAGSIVEGATTVSMDTINEETVAEALIQCQENPDRLARILPCLDLIAKWKKTIYSHALNLALTGEKIPGHKLVMGREGIREWVDAKAAEVVMKSFRIKHETMYSHALASPTQVWPLIAGHEKKEKRLAPLIKRKPANLTLVHESDKRSAKHVKPIVDEFEDLTAQQADPAANLL